MDEILHESSQNRSFCPSHYLFKTIKSNEPFDLGNEFFNQVEHLYCTTDMHRTQRIALSGSFSDEFCTTKLPSDGPRVNVPFSRQTSLSICHMASSSVMLPKWSVTHSSGILLLLAIHFHGVFFAFYDDCTVLGFSTCPQFHISNTVGRWIVQASLASIPNF